MWQCGRGRRAGSPKVIKSLLCFNTVNLAGILWFVLEENVQEEVLEFVIERTGVWVSKDFYLLLRSIIVVEVYLKCVTRFLTNLDLG